MIRVDDFGRWEDWREGGGRHSQYTWQGVTYFLGLKIYSLGIFWVKRSVTYFLGLKKYIIQTFLAFTQ